MKALHRKRQLGCLYVFHPNGEPIKGVRKAWAMRAGLYEVLKDEKEDPVVINGKKGD